MPSFLNFFVVKSSGREFHRRLDRKDKEFNPYLLVFELGKDKKIYFSEIMIRIFFLNISFIKDGFSSLNVLKISVSRTKMFFVCTETLLSSSNNSGKERSNLLCVIFKARL